MYVGTEKSYTGCKYYIIQSDCTGTRKGHKSVVLGLLSKGNRILSTN